LKGGLPIRLVALFVGLVIFGTAIVSMLESGLGLPPWDVFHQGISDRTGIPLGTVGIIVGLVLLGITWALGESPGFGTVANTIVIGLVIDGLSALGFVQDLAEAPLVARIAMSAGGIILFGIGSALYIGAGMGAGPRDSMMLVLSRRTGVRIGVVRGAMEITVLLTGILLGGVAGIGTVALALLIGPCVEGAFWVLIRLGLASPARIDAEEYGALDVA
jgi:uncharacterized membrane protein YczE